MLLRDIWVVMLISGFTLLLVSLILFFVWRIPEVLDELSGRKAKRQVQLMRDINKNSNTFSGLSTSEIYKGISSGSLLSEEFVNIEVGDEDIERVSVEESVVLNEEDISTSDLEEKTSTTFMEDPHTSYVDSISEPTKKSIIVLEEQSSLNFEGGF